MSELSGLGKILVLTGLGLAGVGVLLWVGGKIPGLGRLPGDIVIKRDNFTFYFPLATCVIMSIVLSLIMALFRRH
ncbi:MAG TPA: DUF2905 domain-containing protein [Bacillota bacterium]|nr:DUF2905 domain-containing protein [Bacillota bacterium]HPT87685.1 DUF2905 domain-containing protein [Bacillota bacterium]